MRWYVSEIRLHPDFVFKYVEKNWVNYLSNQKFWEYILNISSLIKGDMFLWIFLSRKI